MKWIIQSKCHLRRNNETYKLGRMRGSAWLISERVNIPFSWLHWSSDKEIVFFSVASFASYNHYHFIVEWMNEWMNGWMEMQIIFKHTAGSSLLNPKVISNWISLQSFSTISTTRSAYSPRIIQGLLDYSLETIHIRKL